MTRFAVRKNLLKACTIGAFTALAAGTLSTGQVQAVVVTFDDLPQTDGLEIADGYGGLNWDNFYHLDSSLPTYQKSGYASGAVSKSNVAFNSLGKTATVSSDSGTFDFNSAYLTGAWYDDLIILIEGLFGGKTKYSKKVTVDSTSPTQFKFNFLGVDSLKFTSSGGVNPGYDYTGTQFALDNVTYNEPVPEPLTILGSLTAGGIGVVLRRKQKQQQKSVAKA